MIEFLTTVLYIAVSLAFFSLAIAVHEFGHFIVALKLGLKVDRFSIGFGPALWKKTYRGVEYRISAIPFGGYVSIPDVDAEGTKAVQGGSSSAKKEISPLKEIAVAVAGPLMNIVLAVVLAVNLSLIPSANFGTLGTKIGAVVPDGPADRAGLKAGDEVLSVNNNEVATWTEMLVEVQIAGAGKAAAFEVLRPSGEKKVLWITPEREEITGASFIKVLATTNAAPRAASWMAHRNPLKQLSADVTGIFRLLKGLVTPSEMKTTGGSLGGPVMIAEEIYSSVRRDFCDGIGFLRFLNVNLAILNLLPLPVLDGGLIFFSLIALIFRRRLPEKFVKGASMVFMVVLLSLMALLLLKDSMRSYRIHSYRDSLESTEVQKDAR